MNAAAALDGDETREPNDVRPVVNTGASGNWGMWAFFALLLVGGGVLYNALSASREAAEAPSVLAPQDIGRGRIDALPPLRVPERFADRQALEPTPDPRDARREQVAPEPRAIEPPAVRLRPVQPAPRPLPEPTPSPVRSEPAGPEIVFEQRAALAPSAGPERAGASRERVTASRLANPSRTIPQGTVIPAVLETALDSTRPGGVRALVQRDVSGFDGTRVLIPRGSRLYGEYEAGLRPGQKRALVRWTRLIRPDGVTIALDSPSSDPLGRAGIKGDVDTKFWERLGGGLLNSVLDIGIGVAVSEATDGVILALPGSTQNVRVTEEQSFQPTLKVEHGTSVSVFVARDLDFSSVEP